MTWLVTKKKKKNADRLDESLECQHCESFPNATRLAQLAQSEEPDQESLAPLVNMFKCHHCDYRVCLPCIRQEAGQKAFDTHCEKCARKAGTPARRFYLADTTGSPVNGDVRISILDSNLNIAKHKALKENWKRSVKYLWYPYKSGTRALASSRRRLYLTNTSAT